MGRNALARNDLADNDEEQRGYGWQAPSFTERDIDEIADLPLEFVYAELRASGIDPDTPLPEKLYDLTRDNCALSEQRKIDSQDKEQRQPAPLVQGYMAKALRKMSVASEAKGQDAKDLEEEAARYLYEAEAIEPGIAMFALSCLGRASGA